MKNIKKEFGNTHIDKLLKAKELKNNYKAYYIRQQNRIKKGLREEFQKHYLRNEYKSFWKQILNYNPKIDDKIFEISGYILEAYYIEDTNSWNLQIYHNNKIEYHIINEEYPEQALVYGLEFVDVRLKDRQKALYNNSAKKLALHNKKISDVV